MNVPQTATSEPLMGPRQEQLVVGLQRRLEQGPPLSEWDLEALGFVERLLFGEAISCHVRTRAT